MAACLALAGCKESDAESEATLKARHEAATFGCWMIAQAIAQFYDEYNYLPDVAGRETFPTGPALINILTGTNVEENPKKVNYLLSNLANLKAGGLDSESKLLDPWGNEYFVIMDADYDVEIANPFGTKPIYGRRSIAWSAGPDGKTNRDPQHAENADNVYSWK